MVFFELFSFYKFAINIILRIVVVSFFFLVLLAGTLVCLIKVRFLILRLFPFFAFGTCLFRLRVRIRFDIAVKMSWFLINPASATRSNRFNLLASFQISPTLHPLFPNHIVIDVTLDWLRLSNFLLRFLGC